MVLAAALLAAPAARAQTEGAPSRDCSPEDIRQALAGTYTGPACRFTDMPNETQRPISTEFSDDTARLEGAPRQTRRTGVAQTYRPGGMGAAFMSRPGRTRSHTAPHPAGARPVRHETVTLDDSFFNGPLAGGVERPFTPLYSYRGIVLISASGETRTGFSGVRHLTRRTRALDAHRGTPPRAYPYD